MRQLLIFQFLLLSTLFINAQPGDYNGPAKTQFKAFWRYMDKLRAGDKTPSTLGNAKRMLDQFKQADPSYNITAIETELNTYVEKDKQATASSNAAKGKTEEEIAYLRDMWNTLVNIYSKDDHPPMGANDGKEYLDRVKALDLPRYYSIKDNLSGEAVKSMQLVDNALKDYNAYLDRCKLINQVYGYINESKTGSPDNKLENLNQAKMLCEGVLMMVPGRTDFKQKLDDLNKLTGNVNADVAKNFTSDFHKDNLNKIVLSTKPLVIGKEKEMSGVIKTDFKPGEPVFGTVYLGRTVKEAQGAKKSLGIRFTVDHGRDVRGDEEYLIVPETAQGQSYFQFALVPDEKWLKDNYSAYIDKNNWTLILVAEALADDHSDTRQKVDLELSFGIGGAEKVKTAFTYDISDGAKTLKSLAGKLRADHLAAVRLPKAGMSNPTLEQQMLAVANGLGWKEKYTKTIITSTEWSVKKNEITGAIIERKLAAVCITKDDEGRCYYQEFSFAQEYTGGGGYSSKLKFGGYGGKVELTCDKIK